MNIYPKEQKREMMRECIPLLIMKLATIILLFDFLYSIFFYLFNNFFNFPHEVHQNLTIVLFSLLLIKALTQALLTIYIILAWANNSFYLTDKHLVQRKGIFSAHEDVVDLKNIRSISVNQSMLGKLFNYGELILETSASGGYHTNIYLEGVTDPKKYKRLFENVFDTQFIYLNRR